MSRRLLLIVGALTISVSAAVMVARGWRPSPAVVGTSGHDSHTTQAEEQTTPRADVSLDTRRQQLIGVRTVRVAHTVMAPEIRAAGTVTYDETRQVEVNTRIDGWIRELYADYTGRAVTRGEPLFTLYSPDLIAEQNDYLLALRGRSKVGAADPGGLGAYSERLAAAARERLMRLEMTDAEIDEVARTGRAAETVTFRSPATGVIVEKAALRGTRVMAGQMLYRLADLSTVWVEAEVYETDLPMVRTGMRASVSFPGYPDRAFTGRISYVYPLVTPETRTVRVRIVLGNPGGLLKPNMLATVTLQAPESHALLVPADAVVDTGTQHLVFVAKGAGRFTPREVHVGRRTAGQVELLSGVTDGEDVAASATFFLDSESQLRGALQKYEPLQDASTQTGAAEFDVTFRTEPDPPRIGENTFVVDLKDTSGQPIADAGVKVVLFMPPMPTMNMPAARSEATLVAAGSGLYRGTAEVMIPGRWTVTVTITRAGKPPEARQFAVVAK
ncbi:MAG TPA: FixH family protein [Vicinamibacterales bacterium]|nr:FixH family protein [Vicinamibacterales bacterium]